MADMTLKEHGGNAGHRGAEHRHVRHQDGGNPPIGHEGHDHHAMMIGDFKKRFYVVLVLTIPIMLLSEMIQQK
jgi:P-type Cu2+ transporter